MFICQCGEEFDDSDAARDHVRDTHAAECDNNLQEYIEDSINDTYAEMIRDDESEE